MSEIQVNGDYSPVSLKKVLALEGGKLKVLVDNSGLGIVNDDPSVVSITAEDCTEQAKYFSKTFFPHKVPDYLLEYMHMLFYKEKKIPTGKELEAIMGMIQYCEHNKEAGQCIGIIILIHDSLVISKHYGVFPNIFLEHPDTYMHPSRASAFMWMLYDIFEKFDINIKE